MRYVEKSLEYASYRKVPFKTRGQEILSEILYADDMAVLTDSKTELQKTWQEWHNLFGKMNTENIMWIWELEVDQITNIDGNMIKHVDNTILDGTCVESSN